LSIPKIVRRFLLCLVLGGRSIWVAHMSREQIEELLDVGTRPRADFELVLFILMMNVFALPARLVAGKDPFSGL
jgi:hypothetical protein